MALSLSLMFDEVMEICDNVTVLRRGRVVGTGRIADLDEKKLSSMIVGREVVKTVDREAPRRGDLVLEVRNLSYVDDIGKIHVNDLTFAVHAGEVVGIAGIEGNGPTELSVITGLRPATRAM